MFETEEPRDETHVEQHGDGDVNISVEEQPKEEQDEGQQDEGKEEQANAQGDE